MKINNVFPFVNHRVIWHLLNIVSALKDYQLYCHSIHYKHLSVSTEKEQYGIYDKNTFFLKEGNGIEEIKGSAFFNSNIIICQNASCNIVLDQRILIKDDENIRVNNVIFPDGKKTGIITLTLR